MIESFSVQNFRSIKHEQTISFLANNKIQGSSDTHLLTKVSASVSLLKFCVLYGYNASGKTNILLALDFLRDLVVDGASRIDKGTGFEPFALDETTKQEPGTFSLTFYIEKIRYTYRFIVDEEHFISEELSYQPMGRKALLFRRTYDERELVSTLEFGTKCGLSAKERATLSGNTVDNISTLFAYQKSNIHSDTIESVVKYFQNTLQPIITPNISLRRWAINRIADDPNTKQFYIDLLKKADLHIEDIEVFKRKIPVEKKLVDIFKSMEAPEAFISHLEAQEEVEVPDILFLHGTSEGSHHILFDEESQGTIRYFGLGVVLHMLISKGGVAPIDELEASLHPDLVAFLLQLFLLNTTDSQIIATTHNQNLMELDYMRNDMIWLCEKDADGASEYYSVQEFGIDKRNNLGNAYRAGKLGAKPYLGSAVLER